VTDCRLCGANAAPHPATSSKEQNGKTAYLGLFCRNIITPLDKPCSWYYAIQAEYEISKQGKSDTPDFDTFLSEFLTSLTFSNENYEYICEKIPDYKRYGE